MEGDDVLVARHKGERKSQRASDHHGGKTRQFACAQQQHHKEFVSSPATSTKKESQNEAIDCAVPLLYLHTLKEDEPAAARDIRQSQRQEMKAPAHTGPFSFSQGTGSRIRGFTQVTVTISLTSHAGRADRENWCFLCLIDLPTDELSAHGPHYQVLHLFRTTNTLRSCVSRLFKLHFGHPRAPTLLNLPRPKHGTSALSWSSGLKQNSSLRVHAAIIFNK